MEHVGSNPSSGAPAAATASVAHILGELSDDDVDWMVAHGERRAYASGETLIAEGVPCEGVFIVLEGTLAVTTSARGQELVGRLVSGDVVGEISFVGASLPTATVSAIEPAQVFLLAYATLDAKLALDLAFAARFYRALSVFLGARVRASSDRRAASGSGRLVANRPLAQARFARLQRRLRETAPVVLSGDDLTIEDVAAVASGLAGVGVSEAATARIARARGVVDRLLELGQPVYGLNTGLGALKGVRVEREEMEAFQRSVLMSHAVGLPPPFPTAVVRAIMLARLNGMARGGSGVSPRVFELLLAMLNRRVHPIVPSRGSISVSDLAPLAHVALPLIGLGLAEHEGKQLPGAAALSAAGLAPVALAAKDALALCSANSASLGHGALVLVAAIDLLATADVAAALSLEGFAAGLEPLELVLHEARPHSGQLAAAERMRALLAASALFDTAGGRPAQDPLSFRCVAQVHGACGEAVSLTRRTLETELNATGDSPMVLIERDAIVSNGNFHPAGLSLAFDALAIAIAQVAGMATGRVLCLMAPALTGLRPQLAVGADANTGLGMMQKTISALKAEVRLLANPASLDFTSVADGIEDHATMASLSVSKAGDIVARVRQMLAIELLCAAQAVDLRGRPTLGAGTTAAYKAVRASVPFSEVEHIIADDLAQIDNLLQTGGLLPLVADASGLRLGVRTW